MKTLKKQWEPVCDLSQEVDDLIELIEQAEEGDEKMLTDEVSKIEEKWSHLETQLYLSGEFDTNNCYLTVSGGAGGTEAQDWAAMLMRMYLRYCERQDWKTSIIEKTDGVGGYCKTIKQDGFTWDYSGHFFHFKNQEIKKFVLDNMDPSQLVECVKQTKIYYKGKYIDFPFQKNIHQLDKQEFIECLYDLFTTGDKDVHSFKDMVYNELGRAISDKFLIPYNEKLYACDLNELDKDAMGRFFPKAKKEDIVRNFKNPDNSGYNSTFTYPRGGAIEYTNSLLSRLDKDKIHLNEELISIDVEKQVAKTNKREIPYSRLISTVPFPNPCAPPPAVSPIPTPA